MENKRGSEIFLGVVGVTTLLVAIIGATFAYFSATAQSANEAVAVQTTTISLGYEDDAPAGLKTAMIPSTHTIANFGAFDEEHVAAKGQCIDDNGNEICSVYKFYIGNPSKTTKMDIVGNVNIVTNEFTNLRFQILDETGAVVFPAIEGKTVGIGPDDKPGYAFPTSGSVSLTSLNQTLIGYSGVEGGADHTFNAEKPSTYIPAVTVGQTTTSADLQGKTNVRQYTMLIWLNEEGTGNVEEDGLSFTAGISFSTGGAAGGVTGVIAAAN